MDAVLDAFPWTLRLAGITVVLAMIVAMIVGPLAAYRPGSVFDRFASVLSLAAASMPDFWLAITAILIFAVSLGMLPTSGTGGPIYWVLPVFVLMFRITGTTTQVVRGSMISSLASPYVKAAKAKGMPDNRILFVHALRNSVIAAVTVAGDQTRGLINGAVIVETVFGWPGVGKLMIDAIAQRDFAVLQAAVLVTAAAIFLLNILLDLIYALLDPRIDVQ
jgi:peptide/nickel transport system permease protein